MKASNIIIGGILLLAALGAAAGGGFLVGQRVAGNSAKEPDDALDSSQPAEAKPIASVQTVPLAKSLITETITAYGNIVVRPTEQHMIAALFETKVDRLLVSPGQVVAVGQAVAEVEPSPDMALAFEQAQNAVKASARDLSDTQERFNMKLATNQDLQTAQNAARDAELKLEDLRKRGAGQKQTLTASNAGVVAKLEATIGQIIPAGNPLLEIDDESLVEVRLGVQTADAQRLKADQPVDISPVNRTETAPINGKIRLIEHRVNPDTRLVDVFVSLPVETAKTLLLDGYARAAINVASEEGLIVPHAAVLPEDEGFTLFTVDGDHVVKHAVTIGLQTDKEMEIADAKPALKAGDPVVVVGNYELEDGMQVKSGVSP